MDRSLEKRSPAIPHDLAPDPTQGPETSGPNGREKPKWKDWLAKAILFLVTLAVSAEGGARLVLSIHALRRRVTGFDDSSYRLQWIGLHRMHLEWTGAYATYHPTRGWALKPGIRDMSVFDGKVLNSNSRGLRGKTEYPWERSPGKERILVLGDSFTFGEEVSDEETYAQGLESALPNCEVLNLGVQGYGHDQMLLYLKEEGVKYRPDLVILGFTYLDIYRNLWSFFAYAKPKFELQAGVLQLTHVPVPSPEWFLAREVYRPKTLDLLVMLRDKIGWIAGRNETEARELARALLQEITVTTRGAGAVPVFVYLPVYEEISPLPKSSYPLTAMSPPVADREQYLGGICREQGIPCLFLGPAFREQAAKGVNFSTRGHWNAPAHQLAAREISDFLVKNNLLQRSRPHS
jgi:hypothetical protein